MPNRTKIISAAVFCFMSAGASAGEVDVEAVSFRQAADGSYRFSVTLRHADTGWDHYADRWEVLTPEGEIIATRTLYHPHVDEQPFTRSLSGVKIPDALSRLVIRGHDSVHGYGGEEKRVDLSAGAK
ncbi:MAG TPA: hypothetical protein ENJ80_13375 [Gammaproteobacteria bacterium]|nr:hypothetical protein [Gammaproteobacteria bacterium]